MVLSDWEIEALVKKYDMISPFVPQQVRRIGNNPAISFGLSSFGYDIRAADTFKVFAPRLDEMSVVDPKNFDAELLREYNGKYCIIPPNSSALAMSLEYFRMPKNVVGICLGKSTLARCGIIVNITPLEPSWEGYLVVEIANTSSLPVKIYAYEGLAQVLFFSGNAPRVSYADRRGKYQGQAGITLAMV